MNATIGLDEQIGQWRTYVARRPAISADDLDELENHLRDQVGDLQEAGLADDEAFLIAVKRIGRLDEVSREFAREHSERLWKQLVLSGDDSGQSRRRTLPVALALAVGAGLAVKLPALFGLTMADASFYVLNASLLVLPFLAAYFAWERRMGWTRGLALLVPPFLIGAVVANAYPLVEGGVMQILVVIHLPVFLWFAVGLAYTAGHWRSAQGRMDFVRFTGEWLIYYTLIALGGMVLMGLAFAGFQAIAVNVDSVLGQWVLPIGAAGAVIVAAWLVETKQSVVENIAPVLTAVFTPLTTLLLLVYLVALLSRGDLVNVDRELLILADLILVLVFGLLLYAISARDPQRPPAWFDGMQMVLVGAALAIDVVVLVAMAGRIAEFGASPNKVTALGLNLILLVNLGWSAWLGLGFLRGRRGFAALEHWQTTYLPVFAVWAALVAVGMPLVFGWG